MFRAAILSTLFAVGSSQGYGPLYPTKDESTGLELLNLPEGFRYISYGTCDHFNECGHQDWVSFVQLTQNATF